MSRYFARPEWIDDDPPLLPEIKVSEHVPVKTGLVDKRGVPIMRLPVPCGFHRVKAKS